MLSLLKCSELIGKYIGKMTKFLQDGVQSEQVCQQMSIAKSQRGVTFTPSK